MSLQFMSVASSVANLVSSISKAQSTKTGLLYRIFSKKSSQETPVTVKSCVRQNSMKDTTGHESRLHTISTDLSDFLQQSDSASSTRSFTPADKREFFNYCRRNPKFNNSFNQLRQELKTQRPKPLNYNESQNGNYQNRLQAFDKKNALFLKNYMIKHENIWRTS